MGLGSSRAAADQDTVLWVDGCFCGPSPKCMAVTNTTGHTKMGEPSQTLNNQLSTCFQQLRAILSKQERSYLKVNQPVTGEKCVRGWAPICPSLCTAPLVLLNPSYCKPTAWEPRLHFLRGPLIPIRSQDENKSLYKVFEENTVTLYAMAENISPLID